MNLATLGYVLQALLLVTCMAAAVVIATWAVDAFHRFHEAGLRRLRQWETREAPRATADTGAIT